MAAERPNTAPIPVVIVRNGKEKPAWHLNKGDRIAFRDFDTERQCYVFHVVTEVPPSPEVAEAAERACVGGSGWHRFVDANGVPSGHCLDCGATYG